MACCKKCTAPCKYKSCLGECESCWAQQVQCPGGGIVPPKQPVLEISEDREYL
jgi:hypothetical protein